MTQHGLDGKEGTLGALKPRTGDGPLEVARVRGGVIVHIPLSDTRERLVFTMSEHEACNLAVILSDVEWPDARP